MILLPPSDFQTGVCNTELTPEYGRKRNYLFTQVQARNHFTVKSSYEDGEHMLYSYNN
jgi:hypothetical protein